LCVINCFRIFSPKLELQKDSPTQRLNSWEQVQRV
jgi:hypothetical protein